MENDFITELGYGMIEQEDIWNIIYSFIFLKTINFIDCIDI